MKSIQDRNIYLVYGTTLVLGLAYGLAISVVALYLDRVGYSKQDIGSLAAWFAGGIVLFSLPMGTMIKRFGARRVLVGSLLTYVCSVSLLPFAAENYWTLAGVRVMDGAASVGIWVCCETILLQRSSATNKAFVMSLYAIAIAVGYVVGPVLARIVVPLAPMQLAFFVSGGIAFGAALLASRLDSVDVHGDVHHGDSEAGDGGEPPVEMPSRAILWRIKNACFATFCYGYFQASVVLFLPLYLEGRGFAIDNIVLIPAWFAAGMFLFSSVFGRIADQVGHLRVMRVLAIAGLPSVVFVPVVEPYWILAALVFLGGATFASISPISLAFQGHVIPPREHARANSFYNAFYALGMLIGPVITAVIFEHQGGATMLYHLAGLWIAFFAFSVIFYRDDPRAAARHEAQRLAT